jgi:murein DD-endopeptidase MepM/ murein hydrolase activator NlpD
LMRRIGIMILLAGIFMLPASVFAQETPSGLTIHVVQRGENLFRIALSYGMTADELAQLNGITDPSNIQVGQRLLVPLGETAPTAEAVFHSVQAGETLRSIAEYYGKTVEELSSLNGLVDANAIYVGQVLTITPADSQPVVESLPAVTTTTSPEPLTVSGDVIHVVQPGETLFRIATNYGLTVNQVAQANGITDPTLIYAGQQLIISGVEVPPLALDLPASVTSLDVLPKILTDGKSARIRLVTPLTSTVTGNYLGRTLAVASELNGTVHTAMIGVPIFTEPGIYPLNLTLVDSDGVVTNFSVNLQIVSGGYGSEYVSLPEDKVALLAPAVEENELYLLQQVTSRFNSERYFSGPMGLPTAAVMNAPFGTLRAYNGGAFDRYHTGTDFAGAPGTAVVAPAPGRVVLADTLNIRGVTTIIDHGWGIYTGYAHQTEQYVAVGDFVSAGQTIGTVGASGRATGAHLHWEVWVNGIPVDPMQWVSQTFF